MTIPKIRLFTYERTAVSTPQQTTCRIKPPTNPFRPQAVKIKTIFIVKRLLETAVRADGAVLRFIKDTPPAIAWYLNAIINTSLGTGDFPSLWKRGIMIPVSKSGETGEVNNYRPIVMLPYYLKSPKKNAADQSTTFLYWKMITVY